MGWTDGKGERTSGGGSHQERRMQPLAHWTGPCGLQQPGDKLWGHGQVGSNCGATRHRGGKDPCQKPQTETPKYIKNLALFGGKSKNRPLKEMRMAPIWTIFWHKVKKKTFFVS